MFCPTRVGQYGRRRWSRTESFHQAQPSLSSPSRVYMDRDAGKAIAEGGLLFGAIVNVAARSRARAPPGHSIVFSADSTMVLKTILIR
jgi:hypothetical protein